jgi:hypothetical protein
MMLTLVIALWVMAALLAAGAWQESYNHEFAFVRPARDGRAYDTGYVVLSAGKMYLLDGIPADPHPSPLAEQYPARWWWSRYQSNGFSIDTVEHSGDGISWGGFAYRTAWAGAQTVNHAFILPCWFLLSVLVVSPVALIARRWVWRARRRAGACAMCGYDLRATPQRCPECGTMSGGGE